MHSQVMANEMIPAMKMQHLFAKVVKICYYKSQFFNVFNDYKEMCVFTYMEMWNYISPY